MRVSLLTIAALPLVTGCAQLRTTYTEANGQPMRVYDKTVLRTGTQRVATGQDEVRDSTGRLVATSTHYENQAVSWTEREWFPMQGGARLDDESFYRIVGDSDAVAKYDEMHQSGFKRNHSGLVVLGIGAGAFALGSALYVVGGPTTDPQTGVESGGGLRTVGYIGLTAGFITAIVGTMLAVGGKAAAGARDARLFDEPERMKADAQRYNETIGATGGGDVAPKAAKAQGTSKPGPTLVVSTFSATVSKDRFKKLELKGDGTIWVDGKKIGELDENTVKDADGEVICSVMADGAVKVEGISAGRMKLEDEGLTRGDGKLTVSDDGTLVVVKKNGVETVGKVDKGGKNKRTVLVVLAAAAVAMRR